MKMIPTSFRPVPTKEETCEGQWDYWGEFDCSWPYAGEIECDNCIFCIRDFIDEETGEKCICQGKYHPGYPSDLQGKVFMYDYTPFIPRIRKKIYCFFSSVRYLPRLFSLRISKSYHAS
jgi:hypothetical protein